MNSAQKNSATAGTNGAQQIARSPLNYSGSPISKLLGRLEKVRQTGNMQYMACCPAHDDKSPSLSVCETRDGTILLHCFANCPAGSVLAAVGLDMADLFPDQGRRESGPKPRYERRINPLDALRALNREALTVAVVASDMQRAGTLDAGAYQRLVRATARIGAALEAIE